MSQATASAAATVLVVCALGFNAVLAFVNAHVAPLTPAVVIGAEVTILGSAHLLAAARFKPQMRCWYGFIVLLSLFALFRGFASGIPDPKSLRDGLIIPTFILLGMVTDTRSLVRAVIVVQTVTVVFLVLEAVDTDAFSRLFEIKSYYINTRGLSEDAFWNKDSNLFVSATRPDARFFFPALDLHRASSIFLEPVSLGNYCVVVTCLLCAVWPRLSNRARAFLILSNALLIVGCDGRLAFLSSVLVVAASAAAFWLPLFTEALFVPVALTFGYLATTFGGWATGPDDIPGRVALTIELLGRFGANDYLGLSSEFLSQAVDSGLVYLVATQTVVGAVVMWAFVLFASDRSTLERIRYVSGISMFMASNFLISYSFLSVKTAALLWAVHGAIQAGNPAPIGARDRGRRGVGATIG